MQRFFDEPKIAFAATVACDTHGNFHSDGWRKLHLVIAEIAHDDYVLIGAIIAGKSGEHFVCDDPPVIAFNISLNMSFNLRTIVSLKVISLLGDTSSSTPLMEISFRDSMDYWSFLQELAEGRVAAERRVEDEAAQQEVLTAKIVATFPAGAIGGEFLPLTDEETKGLMAAIM